MTLLWGGGQNLEGRNIKITKDYSIIFELFFIIHKLFAQFNNFFNCKIGWGTKLGMVKFRMTDIPEFQN